MKVNMYQCFLIAGFVKKQKIKYNIYFSGQNVNSYRVLSVVDYYGGLPSDGETHLAKGFHTVYKTKKGGLRFSDLLDQVSRIDPEMRIRFTSPHPKDFPDEVHTIF
jgi:tRNA A37 methylthiotransferase MiaB